MEVLSLKKFFLLVSKVEMAGSKFAMYINGRFFRSCVSC
jgi:hypothetical protein